MALEAVVGFLNADFFLIRTKKSIEKSAAKEVIIRREKTVLRAGTLKESNLSLSYMAHRTFSLKWHLQAYRRICSRMCFSAGIVEAGAYYKVDVV
jgi:hypothetical protein